MTSTIKAAAASVLATFDETMVRNAAESCLQKVGGASQLALVFASPDYADYLDEVCELIQVYGHVSKIVGCSATGLLAQGREHESQSGLSLIFLRLPRTRVDVLPITDTDDGFDERAPADLSPGLVFLHPFRLNPQMWIDAWNIHHPGIPCMGGLASGTWDGQGIFLFTEEGPTDAAGLLVRLVGGVKIESVVSQGCRPVGDPLMVTGAHENVLTTLSGRPAWLVLNETVKELLSNGVNITPGCIQVGLAMSETLETYQQGDFLVRNIIGGDKEGGSIQLGALPFVGQTLQFQYRDRDTASEDLNSQLHRVVKHQRKPPAAALVFTCGGRGLEFFAEPHHDAGMIDDMMGPIPMAGFFGAGEIGPVGATIYLHGYTASAAFLYDA